jgi:hypothetical protein
MFSRIREAHRILTYREPEDGTLTIVEHNPATTPAAGRKIARFVEALVGIYGIGWIAAQVGDGLFRYIPFKRLTSTSVLVGSIAVFLLMAFHWIKNDLEEKFRAHIHLADALAPYFGRRLHRASSILKGPERVA